MAAPSASRNAGPPMIEETAFAGRYTSNLFKNIVGSAGFPSSDLQKFSHLNCSYLSPASDQGPTLTQLKQHAQALANLIVLIDVQDDEMGDDPFDYLDDLSTPYTNDRPSHLKPLNAIVNLLTSSVKGHQLGDHDENGTKATYRCPLMGKDPSKDSERCLEHVNSGLELLDDIYSASGGLFALLPPAKAGVRAESDKTILGKWLSYTSKLVARVAELETDVAEQQTILKAEALAPPQLDTKGRFLDGKPLLFPQDRYVLANVSADLYGILDKMLSEQKASAQAAAAWRGRNQMGATADTAETDLSEISFADQLKPMAHIEVMSRIYRIPNEKTLFIIPAWNLNPNITSLSHIYINQTNTSIPKGISGSKETLFSNYQKITTLEYELTKKTEENESYKELIRHLARLQDSLSQKIQRLTTELKMHRGGNGGKEGGTRTVTDGVDGEEEIKGDTNANDKLDDANADDDYYYDDDDEPQGEGRGREWDEDVDMDAEPEADAEPKTNQKGELEMITDQQGRKILVIRPDDDDDGNGGAINDYGGQATEDNKPKPKSTPKPKKPQAELEMITD